MNNVAGVIIGGTAKDAKDVEKLLERFFGKPEEHDDLEGLLLPEAREVILNGPSTYVLWKDGSWTKTECREGDVYDPLFGILACIIRKLTNNKGHKVDEYEDRLKALSKQINSLDAIDALINDYLLYADILEVLRYSKDEWYDQLGPAAKKHADKRKQRVSDKIDDALKRAEAIRQEIRDLIDAGEL